MDGDLSSVSKSKMVELVGAINQNQIKDTELADSTKAEYRKSLIKFYSDFLNTMKDDIDQVPNDLDGEKLTSLRPLARQLCLILKHFQNPIQ